MTTILRVSLLSGRYGATPWGRSEHEGQVEYPPSPWRLLRAVLAGGFALREPQQSLPDDLRELIALLAQHPPIYHLPYGEYGQIRGYRPAYGCEPLPPLDTKGYSHAQGKRRSFIDAFLQLGTGAALHVAWPVELSADQERLLSACLAGLTYLGRAEYPAIWQVVPSMPEPNCRPDPKGTLNVLCCGPSGAVDGLLTNPQQARLEGLPAPPGQDWIPYRYEPQRPLATAGGSKARHANRALFGFLSPFPFPAGAGLAWTDRLHRALLQRAPTSALFSGQAGAQPLPEDQRAWYRWEAEDDHLTLLEVLSPLPFSDVEVEALRGLQRLYGRAGMQVPLRLMLLDAAPIPTDRHLRTSTPMLLYTTPRPGKIHRTPAAQAIQSLLWGLGEQGKLGSADFRCLDQHDTVSVDHPIHGRLTARVIASVDQPQVSGRGERKAASSIGFHLRLEAERPIPALGVGWGRHFGAGRLEVER
jgi:CRISPR-associated protein Csb2